MDAARRRMLDQARRLADQHTRRLGDAASAGAPVFATVATVTAGGAADGNALVTVMWRGGTVTANGYLGGYPPVVGDRVVCAYDGAQLIVLGKIIGHP